MKTRLASVLKELYVFDKSLNAGYNYSTCRHFTQVKLLFKKCETKMYRHNPNVTLKEVSAELGGLTFLLIIYLCYYLIDLIGLLCCKTVWFTKAPFILHLVSRFSVQWLK